MDERGELVILFGHVLFERIPLDRIILASKSSESYVHYQYQYEEFTLTLAFLWV